MGQSRKAEAVPSPATMEHGMVTIRFGATPELLGVWKAAGALNLLAATFGAGTLL